MRAKKMLLATVAALLAASMCTACGGGGGGTSSAAGGDGGASSSGGASSTTSDGGAASGGKSKITICWRDDGQGQNSSSWKWFQNTYDNWDKKDTVELDIAPITAGEGDYFTKIALALQSADTAPDLVQEDTFQLPTDALAGYLSDMTEGVNAWEDWNSETGIVESMKGAVTVDGKVYGIPYCTDTRGLWYNKDIIAQAGFDPETWSPKSWEELLNDLRTIKEKVPDVVPIWMNSGIATGEATTMQTYQMFLYGTGNGNAQTMYRDGKWVVGSQGILDTLTFIQTVYKEELGPPLSKILDANGSNAGAREYLPQGKAAIELDGNWITGSYKEGGPSPWPEYSEKLGVAPMPNQKGDGFVTLAGGWALSIPEKSDNKEVTFEFAKECMKTSNYTPAVISMGNICTRNDTAADSAYTQEPFVELFTNFLDSAMFRPINGEYPAVSTAVQSMVESVVTQKATPEQAMAQYKTDVVRAVGSEDKTITE